MKIYDYNSYEEYIVRQTSANHRKIDRIWATRLVIAIISRWYRSKIGSVQSVLCHGSRNGAELRFFKKYCPNIQEVLGTEISDTAESFEDTVQWDFTHPNEDWLGKWDIVYSNSFDHSMKPYETLETWRDQLSENGLLVVDHSVWHDDVNIKPNSIDCLDISFEELEDMIVSLNMVVYEKRLFKSFNEKGVSDYDNQVYFIGKKK